MGKTRPKLSDGDGIEFYNFTNESTASIRNSGSAFEAMLHIDSPVFIANQYHFESGRGLFHFSGNVNRFHLGDTGHLPVNNLASGINVHSGAVWRGDGTWGSYRQHVRKVLTSQFIGSTPYYSVTETGNSLLLCDPDTNNLTLALPQASSALGLSFTVKKITSSVSNVNVSGFTLNQLVEGANQIVISSTSASRTFCSDGTGWHITAAHL